MALSCGSTWRRPHFAAGPCHKGNVLLCKVADGSRLALSLVRSQLIVTAIENARSCPRSGAGLLVDWKRHRRAMGNMEAVLWTGGCSQLHGSARKLD